MDAQSRQKRIHRLSFDVDWPPGHVACYLIDGPEPILVDAAAPGEADTFQTTLAEHGYAPSDIEHLLITHPHVDHIGEVPTILEAGDPTIYVPSGVQKRFEQDPDALEARVRQNCLDAGFPDEQLEMAVEMTVESLERNSEFLGLEAVDVWMTPERTESIGGLDIESVHLPGHQADHLSYLTSVDDNRVLLAGDMCIQPFRPVLMHDGLDDGYREAFDAFYTALDRMAALDVDRVYPGHGPVHDDLQGVVERDRASLDTRLDRVFELVTEGEDTVPAIASALASNHDSRYLFPEVMSALSYLEAEGRITSEQENSVRRYIT